jgi:phage shock protein C
MNGKLYRSSTDRMLAGVCGGLGAYLGIEPGLVRLFFVLLTIGGGAGVLVYFILWIVLPEAEGGHVASSETIRAGANEIAERARVFGGDMRTAVAANNTQASMLVGAALVLLGLVFLAQNLEIAWLHWLNAGILWPLLLIAVGMLVIWRRAKGASS